MILRSYNIPSQETPLLCLVLKWQVSAVVFLLLAISSDSERSVSGCFNEHQRDSMVVSMIPRFNSSVEHSLPAGCAVGQIVVEPLISVICHGEGLKG